MATSYVILPIQYFPDPAKGRPVFNGSVFVGEPDLDPEIEANRKTVTLRQEDGNEVVIPPAAQPLTTGAGGVIMYEGSPVTALVEGNYSIKVLSSQGAQVYYVEDVLDGVPVDQTQVTLTYNTVADMVADTTLAVGQLVRTKGYYVAGDGGGATYLIVASQAVDGYGDHELANGNVALLQVVVTANVKQYGAVGDGITNDTSAIQAALDANTLVQFADGQYRVSGQLSVPSDVSVVGSGSDKVIITAEGDTAGTYPDGAVLYKSGTAPTQIADLSVSSAKGANELTFAAPHNLSVGDLILIYNPADGSWSNFRPSYRAGEYCVINEIISSTVVGLEGALFDSYNAVDVQVYECSGYGSGSISGVSVVAPGAGVNGVVKAWQAEFCRDIKIDDVRASNSDNTSATIGRSYGGVLSRLHCVQRGASPGFGTQYGLAVGNCQEMDISGTFIGDRHGITFGGGDTFSVTCRAILVHDYIAKTASEAIAAADWHGNVEHCVYENGILNNGFNIAGNNNRITGAKIVTSNGLACLGREIRGMDHVVENIECYTLRDDATRGIIDIGGNSVALGADTVLGGTLVVRNVFIEAPNNASHCVLVRNRGFVGDPYDVVVDNLEYRAPSTTASDSAVRIDTVSGDPVSRVSATKINLGLSAQARKLAIGSADANALVRQDGLSGVVDINTTTDVSIISVPVQFSYRFAKEPHVTTAVDDMNTGADRCLSEASAVTHTGFNARYRRADQTGVDFSGATARKVYWSARLDEW